MLTAKTVLLSSQRTYKNFGHKRQPVPTVTFLWHGFLTCTFIGLAIEWKKIGHFLFDNGKEADAATENNADLRS
ncbi:hypothetical protein K1T71_004575 [Dendrolimus kikuchii]|uniref:Uncharacterized protein n=1 Tax=Dendrolimus kikuchii TaxID=765133 RepID=A0ACC1D7T9_9NEOP|nr:hypothetical protein K1T71_004575 [Dendrolimus kikuchii]